MHCDVRVLHGSQCCLVEPRSCRKVRRLPDGPIRIAANIATGMSYVVAFVSNTAAFVFNVATFVSDIVAFVCNIGAFAFGVGTFASRVGTFAFGAGAFTFEVETVACLGGAFALGDGGLRLRSCSIRLAM